MASKSKAQPQERGKALVTAAVQPQARPQLGQAQKAMSSFPWTASLRRALPDAAASRVAFAAVLLLAVLVGFYNLWQDWYLDPYFAAAVKSMLRSPHNFFFVSFDPAGFVSVDKPPLALWLQTASAKVLGYSSFSLLLPQALAGVASVALVYHLVRRAWNIPAAALAALVLALTPISVAADRDNNMDSLVVLSALLGAWAITGTVETGRLRPLLLCALIVGLGFNVKTLQAFLVLPTFVALYLLATPIPWRRRASSLALAAAVLAVVSLSWTLVVDATPASQRPFVGSSSNNTELDLVLGYNGLSRLLPGSAVSSAYAPQPGNIPGDPGPLRLLDAQLGGQIGWLLPLAACGLLVACIAARRRPSPSPAKRSATGQRGRPVIEHTSWRERLSADRQQQSLVLWGVWLASLGFFYSFADFFHPYNLVMVAPAGAALCGIGLVALWRTYQQSRSWRWLLPAVLLGTACMQAAIALESTAWNAWLIPAVLGLAAIAAAWLLVSRSTSGAAGPSGPVMAAALGVAALLILPAAWASVPVWHYGNAEFPIAGPDLLTRVDATSSTNAYVAPPTLTRYLLSHQRGERYILAGPIGGVTAPVMLATGRAALTYGGYLGDDHILTPAGVAHLVERGEVRFFWLLPRMTVQQDIAAWVAGHCSVVPARQWQPLAGYGPNGPRLYDCGRHVSR